MAILKRIYKKSVKYKLPVTVARHEKSILEEVRSRLKLPKTLSHQDKTVKHNLPATIATLTKQGFQALKYICKGIFELDNWGFS
ncbi:hypothetical protein FNW02_28785 [Komarekiella sp. 'clone 1']|uniref:Uncharacterized protein n=1 Tax=Komarekiella delphini-convector SJRDD-AB1 TaxID=2593771 RepID=A0AA40T2G2_9NOST|nr:hypothetical protein [Komarekiella delphini-convector]MBD6619706.1 hypothetical protein [Komarekiella delphini-convector SJRDD-AB1]